MRTVERLACGSRWRTRHPADKLILGGGLLLLALALPPWPGGALVLASAVTAALVGARLAPADYARVIAVPAAFMLSGAAALVVSLDFSGTAPVIHLGRDGLERAGLTSIRALAATSALLLIVLTTPVVELLALSARLRLPAGVVELALMMYRFATMMLETAARGRTAQASRLGYAGLGRSIRSAGTLAGSLLPRVLDRAARMQLGLAARGYSGTLRVLAPARSHSPRFIATAIGLQAAIVLLALLTPELSCWRW